MATILSRPLEPTVQYVRRLHQAYRQLYWRPALLRKSHILAGLAHLCGLTALRNIGLSIFINC